MLKIDISPYLSEKSSDFHEILYTAADFELDERHMIKNEKVALDIYSEFDRAYFLLVMGSFANGHNASSYQIWYKYLHKARDTDIF